MTEPSPHKRVRRRDGEASEQRLVDEALRLFREEGFDVTTMRSIADATGMSPGAAYHYFPSKQAIVQAYYERHQTELEAFLQEEVPATASLGNRVAILLHGKLRMLKHDRALIIALARHIAVPGDPLSAFGPETADLRRRGIAMFADLCAPEKHKEPLRSLLPLALWSLQMGVLLHFIHDDSPGAKRTHRLVDASAEFVPLAVKLAQLPGGRSVVAKASTALTSLGLMAKG